MAIRPPATSTARAYYLLAAPGDDKDLVKNIKSGSDMTEKKAFLFA